MDFSYKDNRWLAVDKSGEYNVKHPWHIGDTYVTSNSDGQISSTQKFYPDKNCLRSINKLNFTFSQANHFPAFFFIF